MVVQSPLISRTVIMSVSLTSPQFPDSIRSILKNKGVNAEGDLESFAPITCAGHDIERTIDGADLVVVVGPYLEKAQIVVVYPRSCGDSIEFKNVAGLRIQDDSVIVAETFTLPYAVRSIELGKIRIFLRLKGGLFLPALPASSCGEQECIQRRPNKINNRHQKEGTRMSIDKFHQR